MGKFSIAGMHINNTEVILVIGVILKIVLFQTPVPGH